MALVTNKPISALFCLSTGIISQFPPDRIVIQLASKLGYTV